MFGIDFSEILVIFGIALVVLGPEKLPKLAATIGRWVGRARAMARQFREQLEQEANTLSRSTDLRDSAPSHHAMHVPPAAVAPAAGAPTVQAAPGAAHAPSLAVEAAAPPSTAGATAVHERPAAASTDSHERGQ